MILALAISLPLSAHSGFDYAKTDLPNGLTLLTVEDHYSPLVSVLVMYHVGVKNDPSGKTGITKLCQQTILEGTESFSRNDYSRAIQSGGGTIGTLVGLDVTYFASKFPADILDTVLVMEIDRMRNIDFTYEKLLLAKKILRQERMSEMESRLYGPLEMELFNAAYRAYPYRNTPFGWPGDVDNIAPEHVKEHYKKYFQPGNAVMIIIGDFKTEAVVERVKKLADWFPSGGAPEPVSVAEPEHRWERSSTMIGRGDVPVFITGYIVPPIGHPDIPALMALDQIANKGESSRLFRHMVADLGLSMHTGGGLHFMEGPGIFIFWSIMNFDSPLAEGEEELFSELERLKKEPVFSEELTKAKNQIKANYYRLLTTLDRRAYRLGYYYMVMGDSDFGEKLTAQIQSVTAEDIMRVAQEYLKQSNRTTVRMEPGETGAEILREE